MLLSVIESKFLIIVTIVAIVTLIGLQ